MEPTISARLGEGTFVSLVKAKPGLRIYPVRLIAQWAYPNSMFDVGRMQIHDDPSRLSHTTLFSPEVGNHATT